MWESRTHERSSRGPFYSIDARRNSATRRWSYVRRDFESHLKPETEDSIWCDATHQNVGKNGLQTPPGPLPYLLPIQIPNAQLQEYVVEKERCSSIRIFCSKRD